MKKIILLLSLAVITITPSIFTKKHYSHKKYSKRYYPSKKYSHKKHLPKKAFSQKHTPKQNNISFIKPINNSIPTETNPVSKNIFSKIEPISLPNLSNTMPKLAGPVQDGGLMDMRLTDNYQTKSTLDFDVTAVQTITENHLIGTYKNAVILDISPRRMWGWGGDFAGYCGETCFQMCGLYFGNWVSSELIRYAAKNTELIIGDPDKKNEIETAQTLKYTYNSFTASNIDKFINWVKDHIDKGHPVISGWYQYKKHDEDADEDYDHIMPIIGYTFDSKKQVNGFYFYDLYVKNYSLIQAPTHAEFKKNCFKTRKETHHLTSYKLPGTNQAILDQNNPNMPDFEIGKENQIGYELCAYNYALPKKEKYAFAITGIKNNDKEALLRTKLTVNRWNEPDWGAEDHKNETPVDLNLTAFIYGLTPGQHYTILRFEPEINKEKHTIKTNSIPTSDYKKAHYTQKFSFKAEKSVEKIDLGSAKSNGAYFYRTVKGSI